tara:strand:+ start:151 stop:372 length:222 start_codon:yes stop_codon:yes gene_type:complete
MIHLKRIMHWEDITFDRELITELEGPDVPSAEWLGGGLCCHSDTLLDLPDFDWWLIEKCWETLCVLDGTRVTA